MSATFAQQPSGEKDHVLVSVKNTDEQIPVDAFDLAGIWNSLTAPRPILGNNAFANSYVELTLGYRVDVRDAWTEDYPGQVKNCTWKVVDQALQFYSPDLGRVDITVEKLEKSNFYEFTLNNVTYRKLVNISRNKSSKRS